MTTSLSTLTKNIHNAAQIMIKAFLRRAVLYLERKSLTNHRRFFIFGVFALIGVILGSGGNYQVERHSY